MRKNVALPRSRVGLGFGTLIPGFGCETALASRNWSLSPVTPGKRKSEKPCAAREAERNRLSDARFIQRATVMRAHSQVEKSEGASRSPLSPTEAQDGRFDSPDGVELHCFHAASGLLPLVVFLSVPIIVPPK